MAEPDTSIPPIAWADALSIGDDSIDREHRNFVAAVNELVNLLQRQAERGTIIAHLAQMVQDAAGHFAAEEISLKRYGLNSVSDHQNEHSRIMLVMYDLLGSASSNVSDTEVKQHALNIREQLLTHFLRFDLRYKSQILAAQGR